MPPKKKPVNSIVGVYDVNIMTDGELKMYIGALREESERMKTTFNVHQSDKRELTELLRNTQENILDRYEILIQKEMELEQLLCESSDQLKAEDERQLIADIERNESVARNVLENYTEVERIGRDYKDTVNTLSRNRHEKQNAVDMLPLSQKYLSSELKEDDENQISTVAEDKRRILSDISTEYIDKYQHTMMQFCDEKMEAMESIWEEGLDGNISSNTFTENIQRMSRYFKDISWKNIKASTSLKVKVEKLEKELNKLKIQLRDAEGERKKLLQEVDQPDSASDISSYTETTDAEDTCLDELTYENDALTEKLRQVTEERDILRTRFIAAMRRIHRKAEFTSFLAEQILTSLQNARNIQDFKLFSNEFDHSSHQENQELSSDIGTTDCDYYYSEPELVTTRSD